MATASADTHQFLKPFAENIWTVDGPTVDFFGFPFPTRCVVIRLRDGSAFLYNAIQWSAALSMEIALVVGGPLQYIVTPNKLHCQFLPEWQREHPECRFLGPPGGSEHYYEAAAHDNNKERRRNLSFDAILDELPETGYAADLEQVIFRSPVLDEVVFFHKHTRTVLFADLIQRHDEGSIQGWKGLLMKMDGLVGSEGSTPREWRKSFLSEPQYKHAARRNVNRILLQWQPLQMIVMYGECIREKDNDGDEMHTCSVIARALQWIPLEPSEQRPLEFLTSMPFQFAFQPQNSPYSAHPKHGVHQEVEPGDEDQLQKPLHVNCMHPIQSRAPTLDCTGCPQPPASLIQLPAIACGSKDSPSSLIELPSTERCTGGFVRFVKPMFDEDDSNDTMSPEEEAELKRRTDLALWHREHDYSVQKWGSLPNGVPPDDNTMRQSEPILCGNNNGGNNHFSLPEAINCSTGQRTETILCGAFPVPSTVVASTKGPKFVPIHENGDSFGNDDLAETLVPSSSPPSSAPPALGDQFSQMFDHDDLAELYAIPATNGGTSTTKPNPSTHGETQSTTLEPLPAALKQNPGNTTTPFRRNVSPAVVLDAHKGDHTDRQQERKSAVSNKAKNNSIERRPKHEKGMAFPTIFRRDATSPPGTDSKQSSSLHSSFSFRYKKKADSGQKSHLGFSSKCQGQEQFSKPDADNQNNGQVPSEQKDQTEQDSPQRPPNNHHQRSHGAPRFVWEV